MKKSKKILKIVLNVFIWIFVVFSVLMTVLALAAQSNADGIPSIGGKCFLTVSTNSMHPTFSEGDLIFGDMLTADEKTKLQIGDVITFYADLDGNGSTELNSHRIVDINYDTNGNVESYVTKGDNPKTNVVQDKDPVQWQYVISKWTGSRIGGIGGFLAFLQTPKGFLIVIVLPLIVFFLYELYVFIKTLLAVKGKKEKENGKTISAEDEEAIKQKAIEEYIRQQQQAQRDAAPVPNETPAPEASAEETNAPQESTEETAAPEESIEEAAAPEESAEETVEVADSADESKPQ